MKIISSINREILARSIQRAKERNIILPTFAQQKDPRKIPAKILEKLKGLDLLAINPLNLFRITWKNDPVTGGFGEGNWVEFPKEITGVDARIVGLVGRYFPTGAHKVGAAYGCLVPRLVSGNFDPTTQKAVWPSTGNYCRGGAFDCALLACPAVAILPEGMSQERFDWLREINTDEIIATPGTESNVKEIYDMCWKLRRERGDSIVIFNQFEEFGNSIWHYQMTGGIIEEIYENHFKTDRSRLAAYCSATGSAGTIAAGDFLRTIHPHIRVVANEALQCPTLYQFGFGAHRIEGIGDKHLPWVHNIRNTDAIAAIDDEQVMQLLRLFNEPAGQDYLRKQGVSDEIVAQLPFAGISSICNLVSAIWTARYYEMDSRDVIFLPLTDSMDLYSSRQAEMTEQHGPYTTEMAARHYGRYLEACIPSSFRELNYFERKSLHNFKYFTWVEQQAKDSEDLRAMWDEDFWKEVFDPQQVAEWDQLINEFNEATGLLKNL
ncbi:MAG TPA: pyridoxal-phosphate dependent enzyme [Kiritimatiellia bacterium]|jgi:cysteine synthase|nr:MAG: Cysteine synthase [Verrucomicrobia bacterium ADurb.Bin018]HOE00814.1 pyridoxal-phosphate dependent enzyme [Kiritimatiellia bacterium]HOE37683.1 pyridoxal-phosphate dependent enzyme [Kiritimatiellia bacterium]HOU59207.1 pyridoxal-phosphate dependent enzyme [Kiritimatiellia bacterium]HPK69600.1 pyridoxal-phosphate dependent enzyme [Kiritimatiellia bacterium]